MPRVIIELLQQPHINLSGLCEAISVNRQQLGNIIAGASPMPLGVMTKIVKYFASSTGGLCLRGHLIIWEDRAFIARKILEVQEPVGNFINAALIENEVHDIDDLHNFLNQLK